MARIILALVLSGCLAAVDAPSSDGSVVAYRDGGGELVALPLPDALAEPSLHPLGHATVEPSIAATSDGSLFVAADTTVLRSRDDGATWEAVHEYAVTPTIDLPSPLGYLQPLPPTLDPWVWADPGTDRVFIDHLTLACTSLAWSDDVGDTWTPVWPLACPSPVVDFQKLVTGPPGPEPNPAAGDAFPSVAYLCYNKPVWDASGATASGRYSMACAASYDGGRMWQNEQVLGAAVVVNGELVAGDCAGGSWIPAVAPDGTVVVRSQSFTTDPLGCVYRSRDSGMSWQHVGPGPEFGGSHLAFDAAGVLYALSPWWEPPLRISVSRDQGETWDAPYTVMPPGIHGPLFPTLSAGDGGKLFIPFWGTTEALDDELLAGDDARWHAWLLVVDAADGPDHVTVAYRATPDDAPMYIGPGWTDMRAGYWMGDFVTATVGPDGTPYVVFPQTCNDGCQGNHEATRGDQQKLGTVVALRGYSLRG